MTNISLSLLVVIVFAPGILLFDASYDYDFYPLRRFVRGPPSFARGGGNGNRGKGNKNGPPGHSRGHGNQGNRGNSGNHGPPPFAHGHGHNFESGSSEEDYDYDIKTTTRRPNHITTTTESGYKPLMTRPTTSDYSDLIDVRILGDRSRRATKSSDPSTTEILSRFNSLGHFPSWNTPDPNYKPHFFHPQRLTSCVEKKSDCIPAYECKTFPRRNSDVSFCRWVRDEPYVCCEKHKEKFQNYEIKCGQKVKENLQSQAIIGGTRVNGDIGYPWMVAIGEFVDNGSVDWYCGGALVGEKTVITAAHCVSKRQASVIRIGDVDLTVRLSDPSSSVQEIKVCKTLIHPLYRSPLLYNDLALLYLDEPVKYSTFAKPICLPQKTSISETPLALLTGWGQLSFASERSTILHEVTVKVFNNSYCDQQYSLTQASKRNFPRGILDTQLCAGDEEGGKDACQGDSGAPLVTEEDGSFVLIGLVSAGIGCGSKSFPGVYTRISAFTPWILENIS